MKEISQERKEELELISGSVGTTRHKGIRTIMRKRNISYEKAKTIQSKAIVRNGRGQSTS